MAIVKMKRLFLAALKSDRDDLLSELMRLSCVEISSPEEGLWHNEMAELLNPEDKASESLENEVKQLASAIDTISRYDKSKKPLFAQRTPVSASELDRMRVRAADSAAQAAVCISRLNELRNEENRLKAIAASLEPYKALNVDLGESGTLKTNFFVGTVPTSVEQASIEAAFEENSPETYYSILGADKDQQYIFGIYLKEKEEEATAALKAIGFQKASFRDISGTPSQNISDIQNKLKEIEAERARVDEELEKLVPELPNIKGAYDSLSVALQKQKQTEQLLCSRDAFFIEGWIPEKNAADLDKALAKFDCSYDIRDPQEGEEPPVLLQNSKLVSPFSSITEMYSLPAYGTVDPNVFVAVFYFVFFGMMLSDAAYGLILAIAGLFITFKYKPEGSLGKIIFLLGLCGISTVAWGAAFGGFFGNVIQVVSSTFFGKEVVVKPLWFDPLSEPMKLLAICLVLGGIHLFVGMGLKAYMLVREGKIFSAIFDIGFWYVIIIGAAGYLFLDFGKQTFMYMLIVGLIGAVVTGGRANKNPIMKVLGGLISIYNNATGYLSDILSYSRLLALGLSTGVVASVFNTLGSLGGRTVFGVIIFIVVFLFGTALNIFINTLGAFVHTSRLQYVEFFGKFYETGGRAFNPFIRKTKYIRIIDKEAI